MIARNLSLVMVLGCLTSITLHGAVVPGRWEKMEALKEGTELIVTLDSKDRVEGRLLSVESSSLLLDVEEGEELRLPKSQILKVTSQDRTEQDSVKDGLLWGSVVGAAVGLPWLIYGFTYQGGESDDAKAIGTGICLMSVGIGAGVGVAADAVRKGHEVFYVAAGD